MEIFRSTKGQVILFPIVWIALFCLVLFIAGEPGELEYEVKEVTRFAWMENRMLYVFLLIGSIFFPFILSFDKNVHFYKKWKPLFMANIIAAFFFLLWDVVFTKIGAWGFNPKYHSDWVIAGLPVEEWLWFFVIPYCCIFIYECLNFYIKKNPLLYLERPVTWILIVVFGAIGIWSRDHIYTSLTFLSAGAITYFHLRYRPSTERSRFYLAWLVSFIPFLMVNGALTGAFTEAPVVVYGDTAFSGWRWWTIPAEDYVYLYVYLMWIVYLFEIFSEKNPPEGTNL